jgi:membrane protein YdbS with pleckstrin-like domain
MSLLTELIIRVVLIIALNDGIIFYVISRRSQKMTLPLAFEIIIITIIILVINIWYCLHRRGLA